METTQPQHHYGVGAVLFLRLQHAGLPLTRHTHMQVIEAFNIVMELATQNIIPAWENQEENKKQFEALKIMEEVMTPQLKGYVKIRDGYANNTMQVWWRGENGPELADLSKNNGHWENLVQHPHLFSFAIPKHKVVYEG